MYLTQYQCKSGKIENINQNQLAGIGCFQVLHNISIWVEGKDQGRHVSAVKCESVEMSHVGVIKSPPNLPMLVKSLDGNFCQPEL